MVTGVQTCALPILRLGAYPCKIKKNTIAFKVFGKTLIHERHRHRYEFNNKYRKVLERKGMVFSGIYPKKNLVEIIELSATKHGGSTSNCGGKNHPYFIAVQFHPEFKSKPDKAHPLFKEFIKAALNSKFQYTNSKQIPMTKYPMS